MKNKILPVIGLVLLASSFFLIHKLLKVFSISPPELLKTENITKEEYDKMETNDIHSFKSITGLFEGKKIVYKKINAPVKTIEKPLIKPIKTIPSIRYLGAVADQTGEMKYYLMDETRRTLLKLRKGDSLDGIILISVEENRLQLSVEGVIIEINK